MGIPAGVPQCLTTYSGTERDVYIFKLSNSTQKGPRFSEDTIIAFLSTAGDTFPTEKNIILLVLVITGATGEK